jgi:hypothetical protein
MGQKASRVSTSPRRGGHSTHRASVSFGRFSGLKAESDLGCTNISRRRIITFVATTGRTRLRASYVDARNAFMSDFERQCVMRVTVHAINSNPCGLPSVSR